MGLIRERPLVWLLPAFCVLAAITLPPFIYSIYLSLVDYNISMEYLGKPWAGLSNYIEIFHDSRAINAFWVTFKLVSLATLCQSLLGLTIAILFQHLHRSKPIFYTILAVPMLIPRMVGALIWRIMYHPVVGVLNYFSNLFFGLTIEWLANPSVAPYAVILTDIWQWTPFIALITSAGLETVPAEVIEAASIDGAKGHQIFLHITFPHIKLIFTMALLFRIIEALRTFDLIWIMTAGGPGIRTETIDIYAYFIGITRGGRISYASGMAILTFAVTLVLITGLKKVMERGK